MVKLRLRKLVDTEKAMEKFIANYRIPPNVSLRHCKMGEWHFLRKTGEVVIPVLAFVEGRMRIPMGPVTKGYLRHFRLAPTQFTSNMFRIMFRNASSPAPIGYWTRVWTYFSGDLGITWNVICVVRTNLVSKFPLSSWFPHRFESEDHATPWFCQKLDF